MTAVLERYGKTSRRRRRRSEREHKRLDIQGLRMVAVLTVFANHLWGWPRGGFVGVDVFFVISGFLITGNLLRMAETNGTVSFTKFYWKRVRRIVPAATVVLVLTYLASTLVFLPFRSRQVGVDALWAFVFGANWHFAAEGTDYFTAGAAVSPLQHYWSLSIEEQFYFVWPALIFVVSVLVVRKAWTHSRRMAIAGGVMAVIVAASLTWALQETAASPTWAYFNTFARVWELGVGALLATAVGGLARIPAVVKPVLSWAGLGLIGASLVLINDGSVGFPAPWALLPVAGAGLVVAAGVGREPRYQEFLRNPVSTYIGDVSYSLYLVHWPVIVIVGSLMDASPYFYLSVVALSFGLAIGSYHFVENPLRQADWGKFRGVMHEIHRRRYSFGGSSRYAALGALALLVVALMGYLWRPEAFVPPTAPPITVAATDVPAPDPQLPPLAAALHNEIVTALKATAWPQLDPSMESVITDPEVVPEVSNCGTVVPDVATCSWGSPTATTRVLIVGDSIATTYVGPLSQIALNSSGRIQVRTEAMAGCNFVDDLIANADQRLVDACPAKKQHALDVINTTKPDVVIISNAYGIKPRLGTGHELSAGEWSDSMRRLVGAFRGSAGKVVFLAPPPAQANISECYGKRSSSPADCITTVSDQWRNMAGAEQRLAESIGGVWIDSRPWFCTSGKLCPSFVGSTPAKHDSVHMSPAYGMKIAPVIAESFSAAGVF